MFNLRRGLDDERDEARFDSEPREIFFGHGIKIFRRSVLVNGGFVSGDGGCDSLCAPWAPSDIMYLVAAEEDGSRKSTGDGYDMSLLKPAHA